MRISVLLLSLMFFAVSCNNNTQEKIEVINPNTASGETDFEKLPIFQFEKEEHDFGKIQQGEKVSYSFKFKNVGKSNLVIMDAKASCGCTVADYPKTPIKPGDSGLITVSFSSEGRTGIQNKTVTIIANTQPNSKVLTIKALVVAI